MFKVCIVLAIGDEVVSLHEDEFLSGFRPLSESNKPSCRVKTVEDKVGFCVYCE